MDWRARGCRKLASVLHVFEVLYPDFSAKLRVSDYHEGLPSHVKSATEREIKNLMADFRSLRQL